MSGFELLAPWWLLVGLSPLVWRFIPEWRIRRAILWYPNTAALRSRLNKTVGVKPNESWISRVLPWFFALSLAGYFASPVWVETYLIQMGSGRDIHVIVDTSASMETADFTGGSGSERRIDALKTSLETLLEARSGDRLGLIAFGESAFVLTGVTNNFSLWAQMTRELDIGFAGEGTNLGDAVGYASALLMEESAEQRILLVVTDGNDTGSALPPMEAARLAAALEVRLYLIAVGDSTTQSRDPLDIELLQTMADITSGRFYHVREVSEFETVWRDLSAAEPILIRQEEQIKTTPLSWIPLLCSFIFLLCVVLDSRMHRSRDASR